MLCVMIDFSFVGDDNEEEDPKCSDSCAPLNCDSINNHLNYLNISMGVDGDC